MTNEKIENKKRIEALRKASPSLTLEVACQLLGLDPQEYRNASDDFVNYFENILNGMSNEPRKSK